MEDKNLKCCQVLSFECYYKEMVEGSQEEGERHRRLQLLLHIAVLCTFPCYLGMEINAETT